METGIVKDRCYLEHSMGPFHVENPGRLEAIYDMLENDFPHPLQEIKPRAATEKEILLVHTESHLRTIKSTQGKERVVLDPDTSTSPRSYEAALLAAGGILEATDRIMAGKTQNGFALVRPPGHHAEASAAMGFCLFNNVAIGAEYLLKQHGLSRILIVDWDLHHGNGTQNSFYDRNDVLYFSTHQFPHYPGTGSWEETGHGKGEGFTVNIPLFTGKTNEDYLHVFQNILRPIGEEYNPEFILVSAGFDIFQADPLGGMHISEDGFGALTSILMELAASISNNRLLLTLEGGYHIQGQCQSVKQVLLHLCGNPPPTEVEEKLSLSLAQEIKPVYDIHKHYWKTL
jgi:acetoin utilization deacetylase AcuC-like enzyme